MCIFSLTLKRVWEGQFQIVLSSQENVTTELNPVIQNLIGNKGKEDLKTQVGILSSPSVLMPIFNYVKRTDESKEKIDGLVFSSWKKDRDVMLKVKVFKPLKK